ncbi:uncharacterized protein LDX57_003861 [Aspergillus melleus]|uniref:uncharacterized protein n=1 Tax=Aspergillus melleus TaxID=138277 RepID=UPI001E8D0F58|nr:uncharacterized protein LDX57_003861 [Aspergillus melleus]KAH8426119.1 hypothetical protein LDX57_003861 [Aspergillus melleus]
MPTAQILESQIAALRHELDNSVHTYDFVEGTVSAPLAPELRAFFPTSQTYFDYFSVESADSVRKALEDLSRFIEVEGPYDGIMAFSMGGSLAATYLVQQAIRHPERPLPFKCAIFLSGANPIDPIGLEDGQVRLLNPELDGDQLLAGFPTAHIWGRADKEYCQGSEALFALCDPKERTVFLHEEGHTVPGARAKEELLASVRVIRRTIGRAVMAA